LSGVLTGLRDNGKISLLEFAMQKLPASLLIALCLTYSGTADAAYVIKLANGNEFVTGRYWYEGTQLMFDAYGGVFGVDRAYVSKIEQSNKPVKQSAAPESTQVKIPTAAATEEKEHSKSPTADAKTGAVRESDPMIKDLDGLKHRSKTVAGMSNSELQELLKDLTSLKRRIQASGRSNDYLTEFTSILEMGDAAEALLKSKR
jgi:hypothetical protein